MLRHASRYLAGPTIALLAVDIASSFAQARYFDWGDSRDSRPARTFRIDAGHICCLVCPATFLNYVEWSAEPPSSGWSVTSHRYARSFWAWKFVFLPRAALIVVPLWPIELGLAALTVYSHRGRRRSAFANPARPCGYDLTGNVSGRCPECGMSILPE